MQVADLMKLFREGQNEGRKKGYVTQGACDAEGIAAVIRAVRDELASQEADYGRHFSVVAAINEILGDAESGKVAGASAREGEAAGLEQPRAARTPATTPAPDKNWTGALQWEDACRSVASLPAPAPDVCEWTPQDEGPAHEIWKTGCGTMYERAKSTGWCNKCKAPIKFTEAKT